MKQFGLIGYSLEHSFSTSYFYEKFYREGIEDCQYHAFPLKSIAELESFIKETQAKGLNITIPYKEAVLPFLDQLSPAASAIGAVNTIEFKNGLRIGHNTDYIGFSASISKHKFKKALILGTGGAAKAVAYALEKVDVDYAYVSRGDEADYSYDKLNKVILNACDLIVNCTPLGTAPNINDYPPLPYELLGKQHFLYDLTYNPAETCFMRYGKARGCSVKNGLEMLQGQAEKSWEIWNS